MNQRSTATWPGPHGNRLEFGAVSLIFAAVTLLSAYLQAARPLLFGDAKEYYGMAQQFGAGLPFAMAEAPFVYRIATPWLAGFATRPLIYDVVPFFVINITSAFVIALLLLVWLRQFVASPAVRLLLVTMFLAEWHGPARFVYFYPIYVDPLFIVFLMAGLLLVVRTRLQPPERVAPVLALVVFLGTLSRESMVVVALAFIACHNAFTAGSRNWRPRDAVWAIVPLLAALLALAYTRAVGFPTAPYSPLSEPLSMLHKKPVFTWVLAYFFTFGPAALALIAADGRRAIEFLRSRPELAVYLVSCGILSFFGGTDTERIACWGAPVVYLLVGRAIERHWTALRSVPLVAVLVGAQVVSERILWPIPSTYYIVKAFTDFDSRLAQLYDAVNRLIVIDTHYANLWSYFGSRPWHALLLAYDISFVVVVALWIRARASRLRTAAG